MANRNIPSYTDGFKGRNHRATLVRPEPYAPHFDPDIDDEEIDPATVKYDAPDPQKGKPGRKRKNPDDPKWHVDNELDKMDWILSSPEQMASDKEKIRRDFIPGYNGITGPEQAPTGEMPAPGALKKAHLDAINRLARAKRLSTDEMITRLISSYIKHEKADLDNAIKDKIEAQKALDEIGQRFKTRQPHKQ
jgi:hypothetical protein